MDTGVDEDGVERGGCGGAMRVTRTARSGLTAQGWDR